MPRFRLVVAAIVVLGLAVGAHYGQTTGAIWGEVLDEASAPLPGVLVTASSPSLVGERGATTDASGRFQFALLDPGTYSLKLALTGYQTIEMTEIAVFLGGTTPVKATLVPGSPVEIVKVTMPPPPFIDPAGLDGALNLNSKFLDTAPTRSRDYVDMAKYLPSVTGADLGTASCPNCPSIRGEGQYGDNYMIDGLTVRDSRVKTSATPIPYDAIEEIQIITDGFSPEYGQALGGTVNAITKSGTNQLAGEVAYLYNSADLTTAFPDDYGYQERSPYVNLGGPIVKDKLRYFASYNRLDSNASFPSNDVAGFGTLPSGSTDTAADVFFGQLTWSITPNQATYVNYTFRDQEVTPDGGGPGATPEARTGSDINDDRLRINYRAIFSANSVMEFRGGYVLRHLQDTSSTPSDVANYTFVDPGVSANNTNSLGNREIDRKDAALVYTHYLGGGNRGGRHEIKGGVEYHVSKVRIEYAYTGYGEDVFTVSPPSAPDPGQPDRFNSGSSFSFNTVEVAPGQYINVPRRHTEFWSAGFVPDQTDEMGLFVQDRWELGRVNLLLGVRWDKATMYNNEDTKYIEYDWDRAIAPRFSLSWDITGDGKNVFKAGWGRFFDTASIRLGEFANSAIPFGLRSYSWVGDTSADFQSHTDDGGSLDIHNPDNWRYRFEQSNLATPATFDVSRPARVDRWMLEYGRKLGERYGLKARYVNGETRDLIDDVFDPYPYYRFTNTDLKRRDYDSYELELNGNPTPNLTFRSSYVHSKAKGTNPGNFENGALNDVSIFLDRPKPNPGLWCKEFDDPGTPAVECTPWAATDPTVDYNDDGVVNQYDYDLYFQNMFAGLGSVDGNVEGWYGYLPYSIDDQVKLYGRLDVPKWANVYFTAFAQWASGYRTQRKGFQNTLGDYYAFSEVPELIVECDDPDAPTFATCAPGLRKTPVPGQGFSMEDGQTRGSLENPSFWSLDLSIGKAWALHKTLALEVRAEVFNVFNCDTPIAYETSANSSFGDPTKAQPPRTGLLFVRFSY